MLSRRGTHRHHHNPSNIHSLLETVCRDEEIFDMCILTYFLVCKTAGSLILGCSWMILSGGHQGSRHQGSRQYRAHTCCLHNIIRYVSQTRAQLRLAVTSSSHMPTTFECSEVIYIRRGGGGGGCPRRHHILLTYTLHIIYNQSCIHG